MSKIKFTLADVDAASEEWGFNCGPGALCAVLGMTPSQIRPHLGDFESKRYTNPTLMASILDDLNVRFHRLYEHVGLGVAEFPIYPSFGLMRIQWDGPWCGDGRPMRARYRHTHWVAVRPATRLWRAYPKSDREVFDVNAMVWGGWCPWHGWENEIIPWVLQNCENRASGDWWPTHCWEIGRR